MPYVVTATTMLDMHDLGFLTPWQTTEPFSSTGWGLCARCDGEVTVDNDSGWEVFVEDGSKCQPICAACNRTYDPKAGDKLNLTSST